ncbi:MAG: hypothetical protein ING02_17600 [Roseomonas sp.]|nr:hypothetical protein [Roseomonas sp.]
MGAGLETVLAAAVMVVGGWVSAQAPSSKRGSIAIMPSFIITAAPGIALRIGLVMYGNALSATIITCRQQMITAIFGIFHCENGI